MSDLIGSGLAFPLQPDRRGGLALTRGVEDIEQAIALILGTAPGERPMRPEFGCTVHEVVFDALERWEPRIEVVDLDVEQSEEHAGTLLVEITYRLRTTSGLHNLVYPFYVIPAEELG